MTVLKTAAELRQTIDPTEWRERELTGHDGYCHTRLWAGEDEPPCTCGWQEDEPRWMAQLAKDFDTVSRLAFEEAPRA